MAWDLDADQARELAQEYLDAMDPPRDDEWVVTKIAEKDWVWIVSWMNRRAFEGSKSSEDLYAGGGPFLIDRESGRVAMAGSAHPVEHYIDLWRRGEWPDSPRP